MKQPLERSDGPPRYPSEFRGVRFNIRVAGELRADAHGSAERICDVACSHSDEQERRDDDLWEDVKSKMVLDKIEADGGELVADSDVNQYWDETALLPFIADFISDYHVASGPVHLTGSMKPR